MIGYYESERYTYSSNVTTSTATTGGQWITVTSTSTACNVAAVEPPPYRRPKPPYIPFEPVRIPKYMAPPPQRPWPAALRRFRGDLV